MVLKRGTRVFLSVESTLDCATAQVGLFNACCSLSIRLVALRFYAAVHVRNPSVIFAFRFRLLLQPQWHFPLELLSHFIECLFLRAHTCISMLLSSSRTPPAPQVLAFSDDPQVIFVLVVWHCHFVSALLSCPTCVVCTAPASVPIDPCIFECSWTGQPCVFTCSRTFSVLLALSAIPVTGLSASIISLAIPMCMKKHWITLGCRHTCRKDSMTVERENSSVESILSLAELCRFTTDFRYLRKRKRGGR